MPIFRVTTETTITRTSMAFVEAPTQAAADRWSLTASRWLFSPVGDQHHGSSVCKVDAVDVAHPGYSLSVAEPPSDATPDLS